MTLSPFRIKMIALYALCVAIFLALAIFGYFAHDLGERIQRPAAMTHKFVTDMTYIDLPRVNLSLGHGLLQTRVRVEISLEVAKKDLTVIEGFQPRISDKLTGYLVTIDPDTMKRISALPHIRAEMLKQANDAGAPVPIHDLFFRQLVIM